MVNITPLNARHEKIEQSIKAEPLFEIRKRDNSSSQSVTTCIFGVRVSKHSTHQKLQVENEVKNITENQDVSSHCPLHNGENRRLYVKKKLIWFVAHSGQSLITLNKD